MARKQKRSLARERALPVFIAGADDALSISNAHSIIKQHVGAALEKLDAGGTSRVSARRHHMVNMRAGIARSMLELSRAPE
jgi:hypothetical protein